MKLITQRFLKWTLALSLLAPPVIPCTAFLVVGDGQVLMGNNEDYWDPETLVWFEPAEEGRHGCVFLGYTNMFPQGGMNDAGLAFDGFATGSNPLVEQAGKPTFGGNLISEAMATCSTVDEVERFMKGYDLRFLDTAMLMFSDKSGESVIVEGDKFLRKQGEYQVVTNFYQSRQGDDLGMCPRFDAASKVLEQREEVSVALCRKALAAAAQEDGAQTLYSNIFDLRQGVMYLYHFHNFEQVRVFDLAKELELGKRVLKLPELFDETFAFRSFKAKKQQEVAKRIAARRGPKPSAEDLVRYAGEFELTVPGSDPVGVVLTVEDGGLWAKTEGLERKQELVYESEHMFFAITIQDEQTITFHVSAEDSVEGFEVLFGLGQTYTAVRVSGDEAK
jgi:hypothetical protein